MTANAGNHDRYNANINLNYNPGTFNIYGSYSFRQDERNSFTTDRQTQFDSTLHLSGYHNEDGIPMRARFRILFRSDWIIISMK